MKMKMTLLASIGAAALLAGLVTAFQGSQPPQNVIAQRLVGKWVVDEELTKRLSTDAEMRPGMLTFARDDRVLRLIATLYPRFTAVQDSIYLSGTAVVDDVPHWFVLIDESGNNKLVLFTPDRADGIREPHTMLVNMALSRDRSLDLLFWGGEAPRLSSTAYRHE